jgi:DNA-binding transcriptional LysR family regulator
MKIAAFQTLDSILRNGSMAAAAKEMHLTPSAVSMQIKQLEEYLGQQLFDRSKLQVKATPIAYDVSRVMQEALQRLESVRRRPAMTVEGSLRLGVIPSMQPILLPAAMRLVRDRHPNLKVQPTRGKSADLTLEVKAGRLDAAVVAQPETGGSSRLNWHPLTRRELVLIAPPSSQSGSPVALLRKHDWISYDRNTITGRLAGRFVHSLVREKKSHIELDEVRAIVAMVSAGLGVSVVQLAEPSICLTYPVRLVRLGRNAPSVEFSLVSRKSDTDSRTLSALKDAISTVMTAVYSPAGSDAVEMFTASMSPLDNGDQ